MLRWGQVANEALDVGGPGRVSSHLMRAPAERALSPCMVVARTAELRPLAIRRQQPACPARRRAALEPSETQESMEARIAIR